MGGGGGGGGLRREAVQQPIIIPVCSAVIFLQTQFSLVRKHSCSISCTVYHLLSKR